MTTNTDMPKKLSREALTVASVGRRIGRIGLLFAMGLWSLAGCVVERPLSREATEALLGVQEAESLTPDQVRAQHPEVKR